MEGTRNENALYEPRAHRSQPRAAAGVGARGALLLLDGAADWHQRPERKRGVAMVCEAGYPQKGGEMSANTLSYILSALSLTSLWLMGNKSVKWTREE